MSDFLREKIQLFYAKQSTGGITDFSEDGLLYKDSWARDMSISSKAIYMANANNSEITRKFKVRYDKNITEEMKLKHNGTTYDIIGVSDDMESYHTYMYLICKKVKHIAG